MSFGYVPNATHGASDMDQRRRALIQKINASKLIPEEEKRFYIQTVMSGPWSNAVETMKDVEEAENMYHDQEPTYHDASRTVLGCEHYARSCKLRCPTCERMFTCHKCHDRDVTGHEMDRFAVTRIMCMVCGEEQAVGEHCTSSECEGAAAFGEQYCKPCRLYTAREVFHCDKCDVCRLGAQEDFVHCDKCCVCIQKSTFGAHRCVEDSHSSHCPICHDSMSKQSAEPVVVAVCGHPMHETCLNAYVAYGNFKCPVCMHVLGDMSAQFRQLQMLITAQPMPPEYASARSRIRCVCCTHEAEVPYHFVGHACPACHSFNTTLLSTHGMPDESETLAASMDLSD